MGSAKDGGARYPRVCRRATDFGPAAAGGGSAPESTPAKTGAGAPVWRRAAGAAERIALDGPAPRLLIHQARFHVGDALWLTPLGREIGRRFPGARVTAVVPPVAAPVLADNPYFHELVLYPEDGGARERRRVVDALAGHPRTRFDAALFAFARRPESAWLAEWAAGSGVAHRINLEYFDPQLDSERVWAPATHEGWFTWGAMASPRMLLHALAPFVRPDDPPLAAVDRRVEVFLPPDADGRATAILSRTGIGDRPFAVVAPGGRSSQRWPAARFAALARRLADEHGLAVLVTGAPEEAPLLAEVAGPAGAASTDPLLDLAALLRRARLLVANDSAPIHLAEAMATPTLYFAEVAKLVHSHPAGDDRCWALFTDGAGGVGAITVEQALGAIGEMARGGL